MLDAEYIFQLIALLCGLITLGRRRPGYFQVLLVLLALTVLNELLLVPWIQRNHLFNRNIDYNIYSFLDMGCWLYVFRQILQGRKIRRAILPASLILFAWSILELQLRSWHHLHADSFRLYEIFILLLSCSYLYGTFRIDYYVLVRDPVFWLCAACIIYHSILFLNFTTLSMNRYWYLQNANRIFDMLQAWGNAFYYLLLSASFITCYYYKSPTGRMDSFRE